MSKNHHSLYQELSGIVGEKYVRDDEMSLVTYAKDMSPHPAGKPGIIVRPKDTEEIALIVKLANRTGCPITIRGGGQSANGVTKGVPTQNIVIDMGRLNKVTDIDPVNQRVAFGGGCRPYEVDEALEPYGYFIHTVLGPYYTDSMAGLISGVSGAGYPKDMGSAGLVWQYILGLKVVLPNGEIITTGAGPDSNYMRDRIYYREASCPDLTGLFCSGGGTFGIITEITMRMFKLPTARRYFSYCFDDADSCWDCHFELSDIYPTPYTQIWLTDRAACNNFGCNPPKNDVILFSIETDNEDDANVRMKRIQETCERYGGVLGDEATNNYAAWGMTGSAQVVRNASSQVCPFLSVESLYQRSGAREMLNKIVEAFESEPELNAKYGITGELYSCPIENLVLMGYTIHWDDTFPGAGEYAIKAWERMADCLNKNGSCSTYTQGNNSNYIARMWSPSMAEFMKNMKKMLDPNNILCPGLWNL